MKNGKTLVKPVMSSRPPSVLPRGISESLNDLELVQEITEVPARAAAAVLDTQTGAGEGAKPAPAPVEKVKPAKTDEKTVMPWELVKDEGVISLNFKLPTKLATKLKYLGGTTYGESMTSIVTEAVGARVEKLLKERKLV